MKKLKKSGLAKFVACLVMSVAIISAVAFAFLEIYMYSYRLQGEGASENIKENVIEKIADEYMAEVIWGYYNAVVSDSVQEIAYYEKSLVRKTRILLFQWNLCCQISVIYHHCQTFYAAITSTANMILCLCQRQMLQRASYITWDEMIQILF